MFVAADHVFVLDQERFVGHVLVASTTFAKQVLQVLDVLANERDGVIHQGLDHDTALLVGQQALRRLGRYFG